MKVLTFFLGFRLIFIFDFFQVRTAYEKLWVQTLPSLKLNAICKLVYCKRILFDSCCIFLLCACLYVLTREVSLELGKIEQIVTEVAVVLQK